MKCEYKYEIRAKLHKQRCLERKREKIASYTRADPFDRNVTDKSESESKDDMRAPFFFHQRVKAALVLLYF